MHAVAQVRPDQRVGQLDVGDLAYFDPSSGLITAVDTGTALVGTVIAAAAHDGPTAHVRLNGISTKVTPTGSGKQ